MKRSRIGLKQIAAWDNLTAAFYQVTKVAKKNKALDIFSAHLLTEISQLQAEILAQNYCFGEVTAFKIVDPKPRIIEAPCFRDRVLHHALISHIGPLLDNALIEDSYACRKGKGNLAAVYRCQEHMRRYQYFVQIDIQHYFENINHSVLKNLLVRKFKSIALLNLIYKIIDNNRSLGLPIGAVTSQYFANYYLAGCDRFILEDPNVRGMVRYMDDIIWFCNSKKAGKEKLQQVDNYLLSHLKLQRKQNYYSGKTKHGTVFCGYRVLPGALRLTRRKRLRYTQRRKYWEEAWLRAEISDQKLQTVYAAVVGMTLHAQATCWRKQQLQKVPLVAELNDV